MTVSIPPPLSPPPCPSAPPDPSAPRPRPAEPPLSATGTLSIEILEVNDHAPLLQPPAGVVCRRPGRGGSLLLGATDDDRPPHGAPFHFQLSPQHPQLARNWSITRFNGEGGLEFRGVAVTWGGSPLTPALVPPPQ